MWKTNSTGAEISNYIFEKRESNHAGDTLFFGNLLKKACFEIKENLITFTSEFL